MPPDTTTRTVRMTVNGRAVEVDVEARTTLADLVRDRLRLTGTHIGCEQGVCGACTVQVDGLPMRACLVLAAACDGTEVVTIEGLDDEDAARIRASFRREGGLQCGFCTPGMVIAAHDLVRGREALTRDQICTAMAGNVCRCTGYNGIVRAIQAAADEAIGVETTTTP